MAPVDKTLDDATSHFFTYQKNSKLSLKRKKLFESVQLQFNYENSTKKSKCDSHPVSLNCKNSTEDQAMENGRRGGESRGGNAPGGRASTGPLAPNLTSLRNLGNTCFLNSVLYALRFTPGFLHNLHHLAEGARDGEGPAVEAVENLHDLYARLAAAESGDDSSPPDPVAPSDFLDALGNVNPVFEGNHQQDVHELLVTMISVFREVGTGAPEPVEGVPPPLRYRPDVRNPLARKKAANGPARTDRPSTRPREGGEGSRCDRVADEFVGKSVMQTKCLECESSTSRSETFTNIDVPLRREEEEDDPSEPDAFTRAITASDVLRDVNKYWCEECLRLNEARRSVHFSLLPRILVLQLKRFTACGGRTYLSKINDHVPTPLHLDCFCDGCRESPSSGAPDSYALYAVIMHLGATLASGHYVAYVRVSSDPGRSYRDCRRRSTPASHGGDRRTGKSKKPNIFRLFRNGKDSGHHDDASSDGSTCKSISCCGLKLAPRALVVEPPNSWDATSLQKPELDTAVPEDTWLECDDEQISVLSKKQFENILSNKQNSSTPYLLFYSKV